MSTPYEGSPAGAKAVVRRKIKHATRVLLLTIADTDITNSAARRDIYARSRTGEPQLEDKGGHYIVNIQVPGQLRATQGRAEAPSVGVPRLRIAILGSRGYSSTYGGFETLVRHLAPYLESKGHEVTVYGRGPRSPKKFEDGIATITTWGIDTKRLSALSFGLSGCYHASRANFDVAIVVNVANGYFLPLLRRAEVPSIVNVDGLEWKREKWGTFAKAVFWLGAHATARWADTLVADSVAISEYWRSEFKATTEFIPYGAPTRSDADRSNAQLRFSPGTYVLQVARLIPENNVQTFLDAVELLDPDVPVVVVGSAIERSSAIERRLTELSNTRRLEWVGHISDQSRLQAIWEQCAIYFHGHTVGGTNPALLQAMGSGVPIVAVDNAFNREVLDTAGVLVEDTAPAIASTITALLADRPFADALGRQAACRATERYSWVDVCSSYEKLALASLQMAQDKPC